MSSNTRLGVILSMKGGLASFNYWELKHLETAGTGFRVYPTKTSPGAYAPEEPWEVFSPSRPKLLACAIIQILSRPKSSCLAIFEALRYHALKECGVALAFAKDMHDHGITQVHAHFGDRKLFIAFFIHRLVGTFFSVVIHAHELYRNPNHRLAEIALSKAQKIFTVSSHNARMLESQFGVPRDHVSVIGLPFDMSLLGMALPEDRRVIRVLSIGRNVPKKGFDTLLKAVSLVSTPSVECRVVGPGTGNLDTLTRALGIQDRVRLLGEIPARQLRNELAGADIFCLASQTAPDGDSEGLPVAIVEAMAAARPVISTNHTGIPELLPGSVLPERDPESIAAAISRLAADRSLRVQSGLANRERITTFHLPRIQVYLHWLEGDPKSA